MIRIYMLSGLLLTSFLGSANAIKIVNPLTSPIAATNAQAASQEIKNRSIGIEIFQSNGATCDLPQSVLMSPIQPGVMGSTLSGVTGSTHPALIEDTLVGPGGEYEFISSAKRPLVSVLRVENPPYVCIRLKGFTGSVGPIVVKNKGCTITVHNAGEGQGIKTTQDSCS